MPYMIHPQRRGTPPPGAPQQRRGSQASQGAPPSIRVVRRMFIGPSPVPTRQHVPDMLPLAVPASHYGPADYVYSSVQIIEFQRTCPDFTSKKMYQSLWGKYRTYSSRHRKATRKHACQNDSMNSSNR